MASFTYKGFDQNGHSVQGSIEAATERVAYELLNAKGIIPSLLKSGAEAVDKPAGISFDFFAGHVPLSIRSVFIRELGTFIQADVPLLEALGVLRAQEHHPAFKRVLDDIYERVQGGESFSKALESHPRVFAPLLVAMIRVGESGGIMAPVLDQMAGWMENEEEIRGEITSALAYPGMIFLLGVATAVILMTFVLPRIAAIFSGMEGNLPAPTRILMGTADFMRHQWYIIITGLVAAAFAMHRIMKTDAGKNAWDKVSLSVPIFGGLLMNSAIARFSRASAALLSSGVPLLEALRVVRGLMGNSLLQQMVDDTIAGVTKGQTLAVMLEKSPYFPAGAIHLLRVGERTGRLADMFTRVAVTFEKQTRNRIKVMLNLLSPLMIVALAVLVALIAISILLPIFQMNKLMK